MDLNMNAMTAGRERRRKRANANQQILDDVSGFEDESIDQARSAQNSATPISEIATNPIGYATERFTNRSDQMSNNISRIGNTITNPGQTLTNRANAEFDQKLQAFIDPETYMKKRLGVGQPGPTVAASQGQDPNNPLNQQQSQTFPLQDQTQSQPFELVVQDGKTMPFTGTAQGSSNVGLKLPGIQSQVDSMLKVQDNPEELHKMLYSPSTSPEVRNMISNRLYKELKYGINYNQASERVESALASGDMTDLAADLKKSEGSYVKAYLFQRLGLTDLARAEQIKLGAGSKYENVMTNDGRFTVERNGQGAVVQAYDENGKRVNNKQLAKISSSAMTASQVGQAGATRYRDSQGNEWNAVPTERGMLFYDNAGKQGTPQGKTTPITAATDYENRLAFNMSDRENATVMKIRERGIGKATEIIAEEEAKGGPLSAQQKANIYNAVSATTQMAVSQIPSTPFPGQGQPQPAQAAPTQAAPAPVQGQPAPRQAGPAPVAPVSPVRQAPAPVQVAPGQTQTQPVAPSGVNYGGGGGGGSIAGRQMSRDIQKEYATTTARVTAEDIAKVNANYGSMEMNTNQSRRGVRDLLTHPGYETAIAFKGPTMAFGAFDKGLYGSDARDFNALRSQLLGGVFLQGYQTLKGGGSITEVEGQKAEQAVSRMGDTGQTEVEYAIALRDYDYYIQLGQNKAAAKTGRPIPFPNIPNEQTYTKQNDAIRKYYSQVSLDDTQRRTFPLAGDSLPPAIQKLMEDDKKKPGQTQTPKAAPAMKQGKDGVYRFN